MVEGHRHCDVQFHFDGIAGLARNDFGADVPYAYNPGDYIRASPASHFPVPLFGEVYDNFRSCEEHLPELEIFYLEKSEGEILFSACTLSDEQLHPTSGTFAMVIGTKPLGTYTFEYLYELSPAALDVLYSKVEGQGATILIKDNPNRTHSTVTYFAPRELGI